MELILTHVVRAFLLPPGLFLSLLLLGAILRLRFHRTGQTVIYTGIGLLLLMSLPIVVSPLLRFYESIPALNADSLQHTGAKAIVILGGGRYANAPEYQGDTVSEPSLERIRYGAWLQRKTKLPILVTGGLVFGSHRPAEATLMQQVLKKEFLAFVPWAETHSRNTYENAIDSRKILAKEGINHIILVTHALHMPRALEAFKRAGFKVTPAPMGFDTAGELPTVLSLMPSIYSFKRMHDLMDELLGRVWYHLRYY
ncbi:MAG: YdcF family protein [Gammaproteobacteria bacterium]